MTIKPLENLLSDNSLKTSKISLVVLDSIISVGNLNIKNG